MSVLTNLPENDVSELLKKLLLDREKNNKCINKTFIEFAKQNVHLNTIKFLLESSKTITINKIDKAFRIASEKNYIDLFKILYTHPDLDPCSIDNYPIRLASMNGHSEIVEILLKNPKIDPSTCDQFAIKYASEKGHVKVVELLLKHPKVDPSGGDNYPVRVAARYNKIDVVKILLVDTRVDPVSHCCNADALEYASIYNHIEMVKILLENEKCRPCKGNNKAIIGASGKRHVDIIKLLIPLTDMSTITDKYILDIANKLNPPVPTLNDLMALCKTLKISKFDAKNNKVTYEL